MIARSQASWFDQIFKKILNTLLAGSLLCLFLTAACVFCPQRAPSQTSAVEQGRAIARRDGYWAYEAVIKLSCFSNTLSNLRLAKHITEENSGEYIRKPSMYTKVSGKGINKSVLTPKKAEIAFFFFLVGVVASLRSLRKNSKTYFQIATLEVNLTFPKGCYLVYRRSKSCVSLSNSCSERCLSLVFPSAPTLPLTILQRPGSTPGLLIVICFVINFKNF